ncbi:MAG TPA: alpha/beta fold hydrolase [Thermoplasmata archaeon]|nr:alpha/beta fold hydrolase [Thermoplasmata archaeon]
MPVIRSGGTEIFYRSEGKGPALVLHTGAGGDHQIWEFAGYVARLKGFRLLLMDQRGRGRSGRPSEIEEHRIERFAGDVAAVLDDAGVEQAGFWGYSAGALVGAAFGATYPARLRALVGTGSFPNQDLCESPPPPDPEEYVRTTVAHGGVVRSMERFMERENDRFPEAIERNVRETDPRMNALDHLAWLSWKGPISEFPKLRAPFLMLTGEREDVDRSTEPALERLPGGRVIRLAGVGHLGAFYRSDLALVHALPFLRQHLGAG